jgi:hypothetical protein
MTSLTTEAALRAIARIGYDGVEPALMPGWPTDPAQMSAADRKTLRRLIGDLGLAVPAMLESLPLQGTPNGRAANLERLKRAIALGNERVPSRSRCRPRARCTLVRNEPCLASFGAAVFMDDRAGALSNNAQ